MSPENLPKDRKIYLKYILPSHNSVIFQLSSFFEGLCFWNRTFKRAWSVKIINHLNLTQESKRVDSLDSADSVDRTYLYFVRFYSSWFRRQRLQRTQLAEKQELTPKSHEYSYKKCCGGSWPSNENWKIHRKFDGNTDRFFNITNKSFLIDFTEYNLSW